MIHQVLQCLTLPAVNHPALMVEGSWDDLSLKLANTWSSREIGAEQKSTEHITKRV